MKYKRALLISIDALTREYSVVLEKHFNEIYKNHLATASWTLPAHHAILTGKPYHEVYGGEIQVEDKSEYDIKATLPKLIDGFKRWEAEVAKGSWLEEYFGWDVGWDKWEHKERGKQWHGQKIEVQKGTFKFVHTMYLHDFFQDVKGGLDVYRQVKKENTPRRFGKMGEWRAAYENRVWNINNQMTEWINGIPDDLLVILTSDHGELFQEDGLNFTHGPDPYNDKVFEIPLMARTKPKRNKKYYHYERTFDLQLYWLVENMLE